MKVKKKLIEVALPLEAINRASAREKSIRHGHPSTLHLWWARRPLATARAVIFAQMVDDPSANPDLFPTEKAQQKERQRLFKIIEDLVQWENTTNETVLKKARDEIWASWRRACAENAGHPRAKDLFDRNKLPAFHDPFAGGGALPLEAQRLGLEAYASDLNPVAVLLNKAMIEIPPKFSGRAPVNSTSQADSASNGSWRGASGLAEDVRHYGQWMRDEAERRVSSLYPKIEITAEMAKERPDLKPHVGQRLTVIAWLWARTVRSPNPAFSHVDVPLASNFLLSTQSDKEAYIEPIVTNGQYQFTVKIGKHWDAESKNGTKVSRGNFRCLISGTPIESEYIKAEGRAGRIGERLMAIVADSDQGRLYLPPCEKQEIIARSARPEWRPDTEFFEQALGFRIGNYGLKRWSDLFTNRQLAVLTTLCDLIPDALGRVLRDAKAAGGIDDGNNLQLGGRGAQAYAEAVAVYLSLAVSKETIFLVTQARWRAGEGKSAPAFGRQAIPMVWDFADLNPFAGAGGDFSGVIDGIAKTLLNGPLSLSGLAEQADAQVQDYSQDKVVSTDPPYYDNIGYADLADFFYVWLRRPMKAVYPSLFATMTTPKDHELVATPARHGGKEHAEAFFMSGMTLALQRLTKRTHPAYPITIYYAFKQSETDEGDEGDIEVSSTGWETFLDAVIRSGLSITGTWPMRTENKTRLRGMSANALASSIVLVCHSRLETAASPTRREFISVLKRELPQALRHLQASNIAPVDLQQAAIGPGMAVFSSYAKVLDASGEPMKVREALALINQVLDEVLAEQEGDFDADTRWALAWFEQHGFEEGEYGGAETLSKAKNTSVRGLEEAGILKQGRGRVRLLRAEELPEGWDPSEDARLTTWESVHHLIRTLDIGERAAADLVVKLGSKSEAARELAYRLYVLCERKKRAVQGLAYNALVQSWPEIVRLAREEKLSDGTAPQSGLF